MLRLVIVFFLSLIFSNALACTIPPKHTYLSHEEAIEDAKWIVRAKALSHVEDGIEMLALEYLKGDGPEKFILPRASTDGASGDKLEAAEGNFFGHRVSKFWTFGGRSFNSPDCKIHPSILFADREYLIFGPLDYNVGFENLAVGDDLWINFVRDYLNNEQPRKPFPQKLEKYLEDVDAVVRIKAEWTESGANWKEEILKGTEISYAHMLFISPPAFFDTAVNPNCEKFGRPRNVGSFDRIYVIEKLNTSRIIMSQNVECTGADKGSFGQIHSRGIFSVNGMIEIRLRGDDDMKTLLPAWDRHVNLWEEQQVSLKEFINLLRSESGI